MEKIRNIMRTKRKMSQSKKEETQMSSQLEIIGDNDSRKDDSGKIFPAIKENNEQTR